MKSGRPWIATLPWSGRLGKAMRNSALAGQPNSWVSTETWWVDWRRKAGWRSASSEAAATMDAAAAVIFRSANVVYGAQICYAPAFRKVSPGIVLNVEIMKRHFDTHYAAFDFLALQGGTTDGRFRGNWATESQQLATFTIFKRGFRDRLYRIDKRMHRAKEHMFASRRDEVE